MFSRDFRLFEYKVSEHLMEWKWTLQVNEIEKTCSLLVGIMGTNFFSSVLSNGLNPLYEKCVL